MRCAIQQFHRPRRLRLDLGHGGVVPIPRRVGGPTRQLEVAKRKRIAHQRVSDDRKIPRRALRNLCDGDPSNADTVVEHIPGLATWRLVPGSKNVGVERFVRAASNIAVVPFLEIGIEVEGRRRWSLANASPLQRRVTGHSRGWW